MSRRAPKSFALAFVALVLTPNPVARARGFAPEEKWIEGFATSGARVATGDFDGDGLVDLVSVDLASGAVKVARSTGGAFLSGGRPSPRRFRLERGHRLAVGDFDGDGRDDLVRVRAAEGGGEAYVALSAGSSFTPETAWTRSAPAAAPLVGDFDGDGRDDLAFPSRSAAVRVYLSTGSAFASEAVWWVRAARGRGGVTRVGDVDRDGDDDLVRFAPGGAVHVARAEPGSATFSAEAIWHTSLAKSPRAAACQVVDLDADGRDDVVALTREGAIHAAVSSGTRFEDDPAIEARGLPLGAGSRLVGDVDGDRFADAIRLADDPSGDVFVARFDPFGFGRMRVDGVPARGTRPFVTFLVNGSGEWQATREDYEVALSQIEHVFAWNSTNQFRMRSAAVLGPFTVDSSGFPGDAMERRAHAAVHAAAEAGFDFTRFDADRDGVVSAPELDVLVIDTSSSAGGLTRGFACQGDLPGHPAGFEVCAGTASGVGHRAPLEMVAHELAHQLGAIDLYGPWGQKCLNTNVSMMGCNFDDAMTESSTAVHLDAWHKMALGWTRPRVRPLNGEDHRFTVGAPSLYPRRGAAPILFFDPEVGPNHYFLVEARSGAVAYDESVAAEAGLAIWEVQTSDSYAPLATDGFNMVMAYGAPNGTMGGPMLWSAGSPTAILSVEGSGLTPEIDVVVAGKSTSAWITHDGCHPSGEGTPAHCSEDCPCSEGAADCDGDAECALGLTCVEDVGARFGYTPDTDVCLRACHAHRAEGTAGHCTPACPCGEGMGLCVTAADCTPGLACVETGSGKSCERL